MKFCRFNLVIFALISNLFYSSLVFGINDNYIVLRNVNIITFQGNLLRNYKSNVILKDNKIIDIIDSVENLNFDFIEIDCNEKFLIPGLIDAHVHLANVSGIQHSGYRKHKSIIKEYYGQLPSSYLYFGFTSLIDLNAYNINLINQLRMSPKCPDIYTCGDQVQIMNDFMMEMEELTVEERQASPYLYDKYNKNFSLMSDSAIQNHNVEEIIRNIRKKEGICIKTLYEDETSGISVTWQQPSLDLFLDLKKEAEKTSLPVLIHATSYKGQKLALDANFDIIAHGMWNTKLNHRSFNRNTLTIKEKRLLKLIAQKGIGYQLTFRTIAGEKDLISNELLLDTNLNHVLPPAFLDFLYTKDGQWGKNKIMNDRLVFLKNQNPRFYNLLTSNKTDKYEIWFGAYARILNRMTLIAKELEKNDAKLIFGSDCPSMNMYTNPPGYNGYLELLHWYNSGLSLKTIFKAITYSNAIAFNLANYGSVEIGKEANLLILNSNPLESITAYNDIDKIILHGKLINRKDLSALK